MKCQTNNQKSHIIPNRNLDRLGKTGRYLQLRSFTLFALHDLYLGSCAKVVILALLPLPQRCGTTWAKQQTQLGRTLVARWQYNFNSGTFASGKTRMAPETNKFTTAWWLASKGKNMPVAMKRQTNNQLKQSFLNATQNSIEFGILVATYNFAASPCLHCRIWI